MPSFDDAQRIVLSGYPFDRVRHFLLRVESVAPAREFLKACATRVARADQQLGTSAISVAMTRPGLQALQFSDACLDAFRKLARGFFEGAAARGAKHLADTGRNESPRWERPFRDDRTHVLVSVYADEVATIDDCAQSLRSLIVPNGLSGWDTPLEGVHLVTDKSARREPFGFRDGISQPIIAGAKPKQARNHPKQAEVAPGEFLLGHPNTDGENLWATASLPANVRQFAANGCFGAFRKMQQHVDEFSKIADARLRAKICGRWHSGALVRATDTADPGVENDAAINDFDFRHDPDGNGCPFGSHVRRMNPRSDPVKPRTPPLMRRGVPYKTGSEEGLLGLFLCASLERQFEFLLQDWGRVPPMNPQQDVLAADPLIGGSPGAIFRDGPSSAPASIPNLGTFVTTKGTLYCFLPSATGLAMIGTNI